MQDVLPTTAQRCDVTVSEFEEYLRVKDIQRLEELVTLVSSISEPDLRQATSGGDKRAPSSLASGSTCFSAFLWSGSGRPVINHNYDAEAIGSLKGPLDGMFKKERSPPPCSRRDNTKVPPPAPATVTLKRRGQRSSLRSAQQRRATELFPHRPASRSVTFTTQCRGDDAHDAGPVTLG